MKTTGTIEFESSLDELAAGWILEQEEGFTPERANAFADWCGSDPRNAAAVARVVSTLALLNQMPSVRAEFETRMVRVARRKSEPMALMAVLRFHPFRWASGLAALIAICATGWWFASSQGKESQVYLTDATAPKRLALSDGSVVDLNANSRLQIHFSAGERDLVLSAGEARFQVAHNAARPFIVTSHGVSVRAVGTAFDVRLEGDNVGVLVTEGKVEVDRRVAGGLFSRNVPIISQLAAGQRTLLKPSLDLAPPVENVLPAAVHAYLSWQDRMTNFVDVPLREMVSRVNRCNTIQLVIADPSVADRRIGGVIALDQVDAFVQLLERDGDIVADRHGTEIVLRRVR